MVDIEVVSCQGKSDRTDDRPDQTCLGSFMYVWFDMCIYPGKQKEKKLQAWLKKAPTVI